MNKVFTWPNTNRYNEFRNCDATDRQDTDTDRHSLTQHTPHHYPNFNKCDEGKFASVTKFVYKYNFIMLINVEGLDFFAFHVFQTGCFMQVVNLYENIMFS